LSVYVYMVVATPTSSVRVRYCVSTKEPCSDKELGSKERPVVVFGSAPASLNSGIHQFLSRDAALQCAELTQDTLTLCLRVQVFRDGPSSSSPLPSSTALKTCLTTDLGRVLESGDEADASIVTEGGELKVHSLILSIRSPVFAAMFKSSLLEAQTRSINIAGEADVVKTFVRYLYLDEAPTTDANMVCHLLKLAHQYEVLGLVEHCQNCLKGDLDVNSAVDRLMLADELSLLALKKDVLQYLTTAGKLQEAQRTEAWQRLASQRPHLAVEIVAALIPPAAEPEKSNKAKKRKRS